ncbi:MAG TPA: Lrp/AsnC family transcriptional regulator [Nitrososphaerales archaeon]|nr:Lrp/AsnC family transcriptional regulator [Nitrososphaerales archaeon]
MPRTKGVSDKTDEQIIATLTQDSRISNTDLAAKLNMSESAIRRRIANLKDSGRIRKFTVEVDDQKLSSAITWVSVNPSVPTNQVSSRVKGVAGVDVVYETAGQFDLAVLVKGANIVEVNKSIEAIRRVEGVINTNTTMVLRTIR